MGIFMEEWLQRQNAVLGEASQTLRGLRAAVVGLGGVGGAAAEALCRAGVGALTLVDFDTLCSTNKNRQLLALDSTMGMLKAEAAAKRAADINSECIVRALAIRVDAENVDSVFDPRVDFLIDAVDSVTAKLLLIERCAELSIPVISCMGTGNRTDPTAFRVGKITDTAGCGCPLARVMRRELTKRGLADTLVLYSTELPVKPDGEVKVGSVSWVPPVAGYTMAGYMLTRFAGQN